MSREHRKTLIGFVVSHKMAKTVVVEVRRRDKDLMFEKYVNKKAQFFAHDEKQECRPGDKVSLIETRPLSKLKRWKVESVIEKAEVIEEEMGEVTV